MLKNLERKIKVMVYQGEKSDQSVIYMVRYHCVKCKNVITCNNPIKCNFAGYIQERMPKTSYSCMMDIPQIHIVVANEAEKQHALKVIERAQRLRSNRFNSR